jgi:hypothetical protein
VTLDKAVRKAVDSCGFQVLCFSVLFLFLFLFFLLFPSAVAVAGAVAADVDVDAVEYGFVQECKRLVRRCAKQCTRVAFR